MPPDVADQPQLPSPASNNAYQRQQPDTYQQQPESVVPCHDDGVSGGREAAVGEAAAECGEEPVAAAAAATSKRKRRRRAAAGTIQDSDGEEDGGGGEDGQITPVLL